MSVSHCGGCHETFSALTWFDRHRAGGRCTDPSSIGMRRNRRGYWTGAEEWPQRPVAFSEKLTI